MLFSCITIIIKKYYRKENGKFFQVQTMVCLANVGYIWFVYATFWLQFVVMAFFFSLCKLISPWIQAFEFVLISYWNSHAFFICGNYLECATGLHFVAKLKIDVVFTLDTIWLTYGCITHNDNYETWSSHKNTFHLDKVFVNIL